MELLINNNSEIAVVQYYTPSTLSSAAYVPNVIERNKEYCTKFNLDYILDTREDYIKATLNFDTNQQRDFTWYKIHFISTILSSQKYKYVIFLDIDAAFIDLTYDVKTVLNQYEQYDFLAVSDPGGDLINGGVLVFKNTTWSQEFLKTIWRAGEECHRGYFLKGVWHEQTIISCALMLDSTARSKTCILNWWNHKPLLNYPIINYLGKCHNPLIVHGWLLKRDGFDFSIEHIKKEKLETDVSPEDIKRKESNKLKCVNDEQPKYISTPRGYSILLK